MGIITKESMQKSNRDGQSSWPIDTFRCEDGTYDFEIIKNSMLNRYTGYKNEDEALIEARTKMV